MCSCSYHLSATVLVLEQSSDALQASEIVQLDLRLVRFRFGISVGCILSSGQQRVR